MDRTIEASNSSVTLGRKSLANTYGNLSSSERPMDDMFQLVESVITQGHKSRVGTQPSQLP